MAIPQPLQVHGLNLSYFTGKLEGYLRAKEIPYELIEMDTRDFRRCAKATGVAQMPQVEWNNGQWLTDTTLILEFLEREKPNTSILPTSPLMRFIAQLLEDFSDDWLWRPALYYRWANSLDTRLMGQRLAEGMLRDVPLPVGIRRWFISKRQQLHFLWLDGYRPATGKAIEFDFIETLDALERVLQHSEFIMGDKPSLADFAFFGPFFRHFCSDPTPVELVRHRAPAVLAWTARLWNVKLHDFESTAWPETPSKPLRELLLIINNRFLPWLRENHVQMQQNNKFFKFESDGHPLKAQTSAYRDWRFERLKQRYIEISGEKSGNLRKELALLMPQAEEILSQNGGRKALPVIRALPIIPAQSISVVSRKW